MIIGMKMMKLQIGTRGGQLAGKIQNTGNHKKDSKHTIKVQQCSKMFANLEMTLRTLQNKDPTQKTHTHSHTHTRRATNNILTIFKCTIADVT